MKVVIMCSIFIEIFLKNITLTRRDDMVMEGMKFYLFSLSLDIFCLLLLSKEVLIYVGILVTYVKMKSNK